MQEDKFLGKREKDNFSYTKGENPIYGSNCHNSLIISDSVNGNIKGKSNYAKISKKGKKYLIPLTKINEILDISKDILNGREIFYEKPISILEREILRELDKESVQREIRKNYGFFIESINEIQTKKGNHRVYEIFSHEKEKFMLKYYGTDLNLFKTQINLLDKTSFFPKVIFTKDLTPNIYFKNSIYYLEEFVKGNSLPQEIELYYNLVGKYLALIHNEFNKELSLTKGLENRLNKMGNPLSESNLISMKIDLNKDFENYFFSKDIKSFFENLGDFGHTLHSQIIHGDLNKSNLIWKGNHPTAIDFETISFSKRINEFIPSLLFEGNLSIPEYNSGSLNKLLDSYDLNSNKKLSENERIVFPDFLKFSLIKSYVIYVIRRNLKNEKFKNQIKNSLNILRGDSNVY